MSSKTQWPTEAKLQRLREEGKVPFSPWAMASFRSLCILVALALLWETGGKLLNSYTDLIASSDGNSLASLKPLVTKTLQFFVVPLFAGIMGGFICGLIQTRFFVRSGAVSFDLGRLNPFQTSTGLGFFQRILIVMLMYSIAFVVAVLLSWLFYPSMLDLLNARPPLTVPGLQKLGLFIVVLLCTSLAAFGFFAWLGARFRFMLTHRMTQLEVQQERE